MEPSLEKNKVSLLDKSGFLYFWPRLAFVNKKTKKIFSREFVQTKSLKMIKGLIDRPNESNDWKFYFLRNISQRAKEEIMGDLK